MHRLAGILLILISAISFGAMPILARAVYDAGTDPITLLFLRFTIAGVLMLALMLVQRRPLPASRPLLGLVGMGALGYVGQSLCYFHALTMADAGLVALLLYLYPALVTALAAVAFRERLTRARAAALLLAFAGAGLTIGPGGAGRPLGILLALGAAVIYALYIVVGSRVTRQVPPVAATGVVTGSAALVYTGLAAARGLHLPATLQGWAAMLALTLVCTALAMVTFFAGLERVGPTDAATLSTIEPAVTVAMAALLLGEATTPGRIVGGALILAGVGVLARSEAGQPRHQASA